MLSIAAKCWSNAAAGLEEAFGGAQSADGAAARAAMERLQADDSFTLRVLLPGTLNKATRKRAHEVLHTCLPDLVDADTIDAPTDAVNGSGDCSHGGPATVAAAASPSTPAPAPAAAALPKPALKLSIENPMDRFKREQAGLPPPKPVAAAGAVGPTPPQAPTVKCLRIWRRRPRGVKRVRVETDAGEAPRDTRSLTGNWQSRARNAWPADRPAYLRFVLYKENVDTMAAVERLSGMLRCAPGDLGYAGTKDKRACTAQWVTAHKMPAADVARCVNVAFTESKGERGRQLVVGNFSYVGAALGLGDLSGNRFGITLRRLRALDRYEGPGGRAAAEAALAASVAGACAAAKASGFVNYFGLQRFGSGGGGGTASIGRAVLLKDWRGAVELVLAKRGGDHADAALGKHVWRNGGGARMAARAMPPWMAAEVAVLRHLADAEYHLKRASDGGDDDGDKGDGQGDDGEASDKSAKKASEKASESAALPPAAFEAAMREIPRKLKLMYVHAYQSKLWNAAAAARAKAYGLAGAVEGDLVLLPKPDGDEDVPDGDEAAPPAAAMVDDAPDASAAASAAASAGDNGESGEAGSPSEGSCARRLRGKVLHRVTAAEASAKTFAIDDVVLPMPGHGVEYPTYPAAAQGTDGAAVSNADATAAASLSAAAGDFYGAMLAADGLKQADLKRGDEFSLSGDYRPLLARPGGFTWRLARYTNAEEVVLPSDADRLAKAFANKAQGGDGGDGGGCGCEGGGEGGGAGGEGLVCGSGPELALALEFTLPSSTYATVFLRELLKQPMDAAHHVSLGASLGQAPQGGGGDDEGDEQRGQGAEQGQEGHEEGGEEDAPSMHSMCGETRLGSGCDDEGDEGGPEGGDKGGDEGAEDAGEDGA